MVALNDNPARKPKASSQRKVSAQSADRLSFMPDVYPENIGMPLANPAATQVPDGSTDYIWQGNQVVEERNPFGGSGGADTPIKQYIWGTYPGAAALTGPSAQTGFRPQNTGLGSLNVDECVQLTTLTMLGPQSLPAGAYYLLQDLLYRAVALTDSSGTIVEAYDTDAYGNTLIFTAPDSGGNWWGDSAVQSNYGANEIIYCGYRFDPETDLYYVRNRMCNPALGRWLQRDPIGYSGGINLYGYVDGRAAELQDPTGEDSCERQALKDTHDCLWAYNLAEKVIHLAFNSCIKGCATSWMNPVLCQQGCELKAGVQNSAASTALTFCNAATNVKYGLCETAKCALKLIPKPPPGPQFWPWPPTAF